MLPVQVNIVKLLVQFCKTLYYIIINVKLYTIIIESINYPRIDYSVYDNDSSQIDF